MKSGLAGRQLALARWSGLRCGGGSFYPVEEDLRMLLLVDDDVVDNAIQRLENSVVSQGHLFECAPAVVSVIVAAVADGTVPLANLAPALDLLGRILAGYSAPSEAAVGRVDLRERCHEEALRGYWALMRVACARDAFNAWGLAIDILAVLDLKHSQKFLE
jgi:hypothetical protein